MFSSMISPKRFLVSEILYLEESGFFGSICLDSAYQEINPLGMVPALDIGLDRAMTQVDAILQYVAELYSEANLGANEGINNQFEFNETMAFLTGDFHPAYWPFFTPQRYTTSSVIWQSCRLYVMP